MSSHCNSVKQAPDADVSTRSFGTSQKIGATVKVVGRVGNANERGYTLDMGDGTQTNIIGTVQQVGQIVEVTGQVGSDLSVQEYQTALFSNNFGG